MDLSTTIIGLLLLALFILPVILISRAGKSKVKEFEKEFFSESSKNLLTISDKEFWDDKAIGIDTINNKILYLDWNDYDRVEHILELKELKVFESEPGFEERNKKNFSYKKVNKLGLKFKFKDPSRSDISIMFFANGMGHITDEKVKMFEKWSGIIRKRMDFKSIDFKHTA
ncbi:MAG TPA: hypothetical protein VMV47_05015 [Bacteroidales bacterium]|nr:hypothetical protein [Bacteroidales bacterium]